MSKDEREEKNDEIDSYDEEVPIHNEIVSILFLEALKEKRKKIVDYTWEIEDIMKNAMIQIPLFLT